MWSKIFTQNVVISTTLNQSDQKQTAKTDSNITVHLSGTNHESISNFSFLSEQYEKRSLSADYHKCMHESQTCAQSCTLHCLNLLKLFNFWVPLVSRSANHSLLNGLVPFMAVCTKADDLKIIRHSQIHWIVSLKDILWEALCLRLFFLHNVTTFFQSWRPSSDIHDSHSYYVLMYVL